MEDRGRALSGARAVFYALFRPLDGQTAARVAARLPRDLESLWKPAYFQSLRDSSTGDEHPSGAEEALRSVWQRTPTVDRQEAERLAAAVASVLRSTLAEEDWSEVAPRLPGDTSATPRETDGR